MPLLNVENQKIQSLIQEQGLKRYWVALAAGIHPCTLRRWLKGEIQWAQRNKLEKVAQVLAIPCIHLIRDP